MGTQKHASAKKENEWTLILWDIENVAVPEQLRDAAGIQQLTQLLKRQFASSRNKELYSIKLACHWSHPRSSYSDLLGSLTTLGDVEALSYQWQGHADKVHNADRMLKRASDRFMRLVEKKGLDAPRHLVVFITSDEDFSEQIAQLQSRNFDVEVLYHHPSASKKPVSIIHAANQAYDWLPFLRHHLQKPNLTLTYDPSLFQQPRQPFSSGQAKGPGVGAPLQPLPCTHVQPSALGPKVPPQGQSGGCAPDTAQSGPFASISALIQLYGLTEGHLSIPRQCHSLLAQHMSQQVADSTVITVLEGWDGPFAVLDFSKAAQPAQQAADAVTALNGKVWSASKLHAQLYKDGSTASGSSNHSNLPIPAASAKAAFPAVPMNNGPVSNGYKGICDGYKGGSNGYKGDGQGHQAHADGNMGPCRTAHNASGYALNESQAATSQGHNGGHRRGCQGGYLGGYQGGYKGPIGNASHLFHGRPSGVQPHNRCSELVTKDDQQFRGAASKGPAGVASNSTEPVQKRQTAHDSIGAPSSGDTAAISGPSALGAIASKSCSTDDKPYSMHEGTFVGTNSNESCQAINLADAVTWGFDSALGGKYEMFPPEQCAYLEEQWNMLQCMDPRDQAVSEHRYIDVVFEYELCKIDLVEMLLSSEFGEKAGCRTVWRDGYTQTRT